MKRRLLFYSSLALSLLCLITIIVLAAGSHEATGDSNFNLRVSYMTSIALLGFTASMALNIYYFISSGQSSSQMEAAFRKEKEALFAGICLDDLPPEEGDGEQYSIFILMGSGRTQSELSSLLQETIEKLDCYSFADPLGYLAIIVPSSKSNACLEQLKGGSCPWSIAWKAGSCSPQELHDAYMATRKAAIQLFFLPPGSTMEASEVEEGEGLSYSYLLQGIESAIGKLSKEGTDPLVSLLEGTKGNLVACRFAFFMISSLLDQQHLLVNPSMLPDSKDFRDFYNFNALEDHLVARARELAADIEARAESRQKSYPKRVEELIESHLADSGYGVQQIAIDLGLSSAYLSRVYKDSTGRNIIDVIKEMRLEKACTLLVSGDMQIAQICKETGYSSSNYFHRVFRERFGISPGEYRALARKERKNED